MTQLIELVERLLQAEKEGNTQERAEIMLLLREELFWARLTWSSILTQASDLNKELDNQKMRNGGGREARLKVLLKTISNQFPLDA